MKDYILKIGELSKQKEVYVSWNCVAQPFTLWPSLFKEEEWDTQPHLKQKRYTHWWTLAKELAALGVHSLIDIGTASGQFIVCCHLSGIPEAYGIDPHSYYLYSNADDFTTSNLKADDWLSTGGVESFTEMANTTEDFKVDCVTLLNFFHGDDWRGRDLDFLKAINGKVKYLATANPKTPQTYEYLHSNYDVVFRYEYPATYEDHYIFKAK